MRHLSLPDGTQCGGFPPLPDLLRPPALQATGGPLRAKARVPTLCERVEIARSLRAQPEVDSECPGGSLSNSGGMPLRPVSSLAETSFPDRGFRARLPPNVHGRRRNARN